ncbi:Uncharacterized protein PBTT_05282 [Plasmodiophora brassicae]|nr:hypothetical protein PBRA_000939 [Plasmodiophora brassicae]
MVALRHVLKYSGTHENRAVSMAWAAAASAFLASLGYGAWRISRQPRADLDPDVRDDPISDHFDPFFKYPST